MSDLQLTLEHSVAMSEKGWSDSELAFGRLERYDCETSEKANGNWRLVYYDGHGTHITLEIIRYACANKILIVCLPLHSSHVLQPLDLSIYGPLKLALHDEAYTYEMETGQPVDKDAALLIIGRAYNKAFTRNNILSAFRRAGIWPFEAIDISTAAPSESMSILADAPIPVPTVLKQVVRAFDDITPLRAPTFASSTGTSSASLQVSNQDHSSNHQTSAMEEPQSPSPLPPVPLARKYATATRDSLIGTSYLHHQQRAQISRYR